MKSLLGLADLLSFVSIYYHYHYYVKFKHICIIMIASLQNKNISRIMIMAVGSCYVGTRSFKNNTNQNNKF